MIENKAVVTGGAGFIGSHLSEELASQGYRVTIIDDLSTGRMENIGGLLSRYPAEFINGSVTDLPLLQKAFRDARYVFHQAALPSVPRSISDPLTSHHTNVDGTLHVLVAARDNHVQKVVFASSSSVYGDTEVLPHREDMIPRPLSPYAVMKIAGEYYCQAFSRVYALPTVCLRYFNVFGTRQDPDSQYAAVIPIFIKRISQGQAPVIYGDGNQSRDFVFVKDVVAANILAAEGEANGVYNIGGGGQGASINGLVEVIAKVLGKKVEAVYDEPRPGEVRHSLADISRAGTFGYKPRFNLEEGIRETVRGFAD